MKISELVAALTAELIRGNDAEIGFTVQLELGHQYNVTRDDITWKVNDVRYYGKPTGGIEIRHKLNQAHLEHRNDGVTEIILT